MTSVENFSTLLVLAWSCDHAIFMERQEIKRNIAWAILGILVILVVTLIVLFIKDKKINNQKGAVSSHDVKGAQSILVDTQSTNSAMKKTYSSPPPVLAASQIQNKKIRIKGAKGDIVFELYADAPKAASNFIFLANEGFYDGLSFHRREEGFVIQGGDPSGNGTGGPGYQFADEIVTKDYKRGIVAMANSGPNTNGSQFFIMLADNPLPKNYTIFGNVVSGMDVVDKIQVGDVMGKVTIE